MHSKVLHTDAGQTTYLLVFDPEEEAVEGLTRFAGEHNIAAAHLTAIGALSRATLGFFETDRKEYRKLPVDEQVELLSMTGNTSATRRTTRSSTLTWWSASVTGAPPAVTSSRGEYAPPSRWSSSNPRPTSAVESAPISGWR